jgi:hypothetical protein
MEPVSMLELKWGVNRAATLALAQARIAPGTSADAAFAGMAAAAAIELGVDVSDPAEDKRLRRALKLYLGAVSLVAALMRCRNEKDIEGAFQKAASYGSQEPR